MDGVGTPIIGRPRPLPGHDTPNPAYHPHTLNYEEPLIDGSEMRVETQLNMAQGGMNRILEDEENSLAEDNRSDD